MISKFYNMPGHLIRRCHQISVGIFHSENSDSDITPIQFAILWGIANDEGIDQIQLSRLIGIDRTTIGNVLQRMEKRDEIKRIPDEKDRRVKKLFLTETGKQCFERSISPAERAQHKLLSPLTQEEKDVFIKLLAKVVEENNDSSRAPTS